MTLWLAIMLFAPLAFAADDLVNERITASTAAREAHWGVDCSATLLALQDATASSAAIEDTLRKCRFIHQPPGAAAPGSCPDYLTILTAYQTRDTEALQHALQRSQHCPGPKRDTQHD